MLDENVTLDELEKTLGRNYEELANDKSIKIDVHFTFEHEA